MSCWLWRKTMRGREGRVDGAPVTNQTPVGISIFIKTSDMQSNWNPNYSRNIYDCLNLRALNAKRKKSKTNNITFRLKTLLIRRSFMKQKCWISRSTSDWLFQERASLGGERTILPLDRIPTSSGCSSGISMKPSSSSTHYWLERTHSDSERYGSFVFFYHGSIQSQTFM